jgi:hypothetical protein
MIMGLKAETGNATMMKRKNEDYHPQPSNPLRRQSPI